MKTQRKFPPHHYVAVPRANGTPSSHGSGQLTRPQTLYHGSITTTIWGNRTAWGAIQWRVNQVREYVKKDGRGYTTNFTEDDLPHVILGLQQAQEVIQEAKRQFACQTFLARLGKPSPIDRD